MSNKIAKTLFMFSPFSSKYAGLYQELLSGVASYQQLGNRLVRLAEHAHAFRQFDKVEELSQLLSNIPIKSFQATGHYFLAVAANSMGNGDQDKARELFELVADTAPQQYKAKAMLSLAALSAHKSNFDSELYYFVEGLKASTDLVTTLSAHQGIAIIKAKEGYHKSSLRDLENLHSLMRYVPHKNQIVYLNSLAVELGEAGRMDEAENVSRITIASPFAPYYPEWQSTFAEIRSKHKSRSTIAMSLQEPQPEPRSKSEPQQTAGIVSFPPLKEAPPPQKPERLSPRELGELTASEKRELILTAIRSNTMRDSDYDKLMDMVGLLNLGPTDKVLDLEDDAVLDDIIAIWSNQIEPEDLAAVISALRDCDDRLRQRNIMDRIIRIAFEQTLLCNLTEDEWRRKFERRLPKT